MEDHKPRKPSYSEQVAMECFLADPLAALSGLALASAETHPEFDQSSDITKSSYIFRFIIKDPQRFIALASELPPFVQDIVFQYYLLGRVQPQIGASLGCNQRFVWEALALARKAIVAKACHVKPLGIAKVWEEMWRLQRSRRNDRGPLKVVEPEVVGKFRVRIDDEKFEMLFSPETMEGSILKATGC